MGTSIRYAVAMRRWDGAWIIYSDHASRLAARLALKRRGDSVAKVVRLINGYVAPQESDLQAERKYARTVNPRTRQFADDEFTLSNEYGTHAI